MKTIQKGRPDGIVLSPPKHSKAPSQVGPSWWVGKSRAELNAEALERKPIMQSAKEALYVRGITIG